MNRVFFVPALWSAPVIWARFLPRVAVALFRHFPSSVPKEPTHALMSLAPTLIVTRAILPRCWAMALSAASSWDLAFG